MHYNAVHLLPRSSTTSMMDNPRHDEGASTQYDNMEFDQGIRRNSDLRILDRSNEEPPGSTPLDRPPTTSQYTEGINETIDRDLPPGFMPFVPPWITEEELAQTSIPSSPRITETADLPLGFTPIPWSKHLSLTTDRSPPPASPPIDFPDSGTTSSSPISDTQPLISYPSHLKETYG